MLHWLFNIDPAKGLPAGGRLVLRAPTEEAWVLLALFGGLAALVYILAVYRRERNTAGAGTVRALTTLRVLAVAVAVLVLLRPEWEWSVPQDPDDPEETEPEPPAVVFLVDESRSMGVVDVPREAPEKAAAELAKTLGYGSAGDLRGKSRLQLVKEAFVREAERLSVSLRKGKDGKDGKSVAKVQVYAFAADPRPVYDEPFYRKRKPRPGEPPLPVDPKTTPEAVNADVAEALKLEAVGAVRDRATGKLLSVEAAKAAAKAAPAGDAAAKAMRDEIEAFESRLGGTNLGGSLRGVLAEKGWKVSAVVVVSDGRATEGDLKAALALAKRNDVKIHTVGVGDPEPKVNLRMSRVMVAESPRRGEAFKVRAVFTHVGLAGRQVEFEVRRRRVQRDEQDRRLPGKEEDWVAVSPAPAPVTLGEDRLPQVEFTTRSEESGEFEYSVRAKLSEGSVVESDPADNEAVTDPPVRVLDDRVKVLLISGDGGWEYRALKNLLIRSQALRAGILQQQASADFGQEAGPDDPSDREMPSMRVVALPRTREKLSKYDCIILFDPVFTTDDIEDGSLDRRINPKWCELLNELVADRGMGLIYAAGTKNTPALFDVRSPDDPQRMLFKPLADLLPVLPEKIAFLLARGVTQGLPMTVTEKEGAFHPVMRFRDNDNPDEALSENRRIWERLPRVFWTMPVREIKPSAVVLAEVNHPRFNVGERFLPVIAEQRSGIGRTVYLGFNATWRWRFLGDGVFNDFWARTIKYVVEGRRLGTSKRVNLMTDGKGVYRSGEEVELSAELLGPKYEPLVLKSGVVRLNVLRTGEGGAAGTPEPGKSPAGAKPEAAAADTETVELRAVEGKPGTYRGRFVPRKAGRYEAVLAKPDASAPPTPPPDGGEPDPELPMDGTRTEPFTVEATDRESRDTTADLNALRQLAAGNDGKFFEIGKLRDLASAIKPKAVGPTGSVKTKPPKIEVQTLWDAPVWLVLFALLLTSEWAVRKLRNLA
jgi:hypothetical protein